MNKDTWCVLDNYFTILSIFIATTMLLYGYYSNELPFKVYGVLLFALIICHLYWRWTHKRHLTRNRISKTENMRNDKRKNNK